ncbi:hypothetical protein pEaSNUABM30_00193 [Erwinia phage pEa_SNUABM_30]|uniref:Uncharacterized protein n=1 Tax=Erwinia phage pEa_SNUABM_30 TaxID=2869553 RepID=A0AAE9BSJ9_9CAUD|nr:hypothetical protein MPK69_gp193 [Erwinia phage pEa_SNUABM_30]UAW53311.1 hypothetical protein pEaSNUABM30_00193 [Erwinia phage pEa_SNUABM_30]
MQYISSFFGLGGPSPTNPNVFLYDSRESSDFSTITDMPKANALARKARAVLGFNGFLNPVRGRKSGKYHFTCLKYMYGSPVTLNNDTDIVQQDTSKGLSGNSSIAESQSYSFLNASGNVTVFLTTGMQSNQPILMPPMNLHDGNCPYGQYATGTLTTLYAKETGENASGSCSAAGGTGVCTFATFRATETPNYPYTMMATPISARASGSNGQPGISFPSYDGVFSQTQTGDDESVVLDKAFCYLKEFRAFCKLDSNDFHAVNATPGTRPKMRFKETNLFI